MTTRRLSAAVLWRGPRLEADTAAGSSARVQALVGISDRASPHRVLLTMTATPPEAWQLTAVEVQRAPDGPPLDADVLRDVPLGRCLDLALDELASADPPPTPGPAPGEGVRRPLPLDDAEAEVLGCVAHVYRAALSSAVAREQQAPTAAVARVLGVSRAHAARLVSQARRHGLLGAALPRRPGETPQHPGPQDAP
ncbi:hypothetical protein [Actinomycetospora sp. NBRC 106375]|uniref:hypothetical protein n=1 Tax=Actinomycetospora sp. NBRC 106375 TaxID=3032207 RepID=UPI00255286D5|nr:hypothetical protein [Actinomycetospora sp. NBRC 106375]